MSQARVFDAKGYESLNRSRAAVVSELLSELRGQLELRTVVDVGCGLGYFSNFLQSMGLKVMGIDGRQENAEEAQRRFPEIRFHECNVEDPALLELGQFDLAFCFGLLYHLENPLLAIRHLSFMTKRLLLVESVIFPGEEPFMALVDEELHEDQGLRHFGFYPTEACLQKMLYRSGFPFVYGVSRVPDHPDFRVANGLRRVRTMLAAAKVPLQSRLLMTTTEPSTPIRPWDASSGTAEPKTIEKLGRLTKAALRDRMRSVKWILGGR